MSIRDRDHKRFVVLVITTALPNALPPYSLLQSAHSANDDAREAFGDDRLGVRHHALD